VQLVQNTRGGKIMINLKNFKSIFLTVLLTMGVSVIASQNVFATTYTVIKGDSLYKISHLFNTTTANLINDNNLSNTIIHPGEVLDVSRKTYTVKNGDCLFAIAKNTELPLNNLRKFNNKWTDCIYEGQVLNLSETINAIVPESPIVKQTSHSSFKYTASEVDLLARLITAEAKGEPYEAQVAVGAVVMNRVKSCSFPNSISAVINQSRNGRYQFTPVFNGSINKPAQASAVKAAIEALNGNDPTNKSLFFYDNSATDKWILSQPVSVKINKMVFAY